MIRSNRHFRIWPTLVSTALLVPMLWMVQLNAGASQADGNCLVAFRTSDELLALIDDANDDPPPNAGNLPPAYGTALAGASYDVRAGNREVSRLLLDDRNLLGQVLNPLADFGTVPFNDLAQVIAVLENWSECVKENPRPEVLAGFLTNHALSWVYAPGDPFRVQESPAAAVYSPSAARSVGSLPLLMTDAGVLSDGRVAVVIAEGSTLEEHATVLGPYAPASLWLLDHTDRGWMVDGIIGDFTTTDFDWIVV